MNNLDDIFQTIERDIGEVMRDLDRIFSGQYVPMRDGVESGRAKPATRAALSACEDSADATYDLAFLNTDVDWYALLPKINPAARGSFCFHGLSGTGKSALARECARLLKRPLMLRRGSDFLSRYVGETENKIAAAFSEAANENAVLVIDEVEGMLFNRTEASQSWELTQVNEMLCQMEDFGGLFICTTNDLSALDPATLRRFSLKCEFRALRKEQCLALFQRWCATGCPTRLTPKSTPALHARIQALTNLTPGDFKAAACRLSLFDPRWTPTELCAQLEAECRTKPGQSRPIGFTH